MLREGISFSVLPIRVCKVLSLRCHLVDGSRLIPLAVVEHPFYLEGWQWFVSWHVLLVNMNCFCTCCQTPILKLRKDKGGFPAFVTVQTRGVLLFPDLTVDF